MTVELPTEKHLKYLAKVQETLRIGFLDLKKTDKLVGYLVYVTSIQRKMKLVLWDIFAFRQSFDDKWGTREPLRAHRQALSIFQKFLEQPRIVLDLSIPSTVSNVELCSDASNIGLGICVNKFAKFWPLVPNWRMELNTHIGPAEAWGVEAVVDAAVRLGVKDCVAVSLCDNLGFVQAYEKGWSRNLFQNKAIKRLNEEMLPAGILLRLKRVPSETMPADPVSRGETPEHYRPFEINLPAPHGTVGGPRP